MPDQATATFLENLAQLGPFVAVLTLLFIAAIWLILGLWKEDRAELKNSHAQRLADTQVMTQAMKAMTDALLTLTNEQSKSSQAVQTLQQEMSRLVTEIARGKS